MKQICSFVTILICLSLVGCTNSKSKNDISIYVNPTMHHGEEIFATQAPSEKLPHKEAQTPSVRFGANSKTVFTTNMQWKLAGSIFVCEEFTFTLPPAWKDFFAFELSEATTESHTTRNFKFFVTDPDTQIQAQVYEIKCVTKDYVEKFGKDYGIPLGTSANDNYIYTGLPVEENVPNGYTNEEVFVEIANIVLSQEFKVILTV